MVDVYDPFVMKKVFISYTMRDDYITTTLLLKIEADVSKYNSCYIDFLHNDSENKQERVEIEVQKSKFLVLLKSESISKSNWVQRELKLALKNDIKVIDIVIDKLKTESEISHLVVKAIKANKKFQSTAGSAVHFQRSFLYQSLVC